MRNHLEDISPDGIMSAFNGLLSVDPKSAYLLRNAYTKKGGTRISISEQTYLPGISAIYEAIEQEPSPVSLHALFSYQHTPEDMPTSPERFYKIHTLFSNWALRQAAMGHVEEWCIRWMRRQDTWGYDLTHQLLAWLLCIKRQHRLDEAHTMASRLAWRLHHQVKNCQCKVYYDLFAESIAFLGMAGFPPHLLIEEYRHILKNQCSDGGWFFEELPIEHPQLNTIQHRGHATGLSICALAYLLRAFKTRALKL